jgi:hypothetical protein
MAGRQILGQRPSNHALVILGEETGEKPRYGSGGNTKEIAEKPALEPVAMAREDVAKTEGKQSKRDLIHMISHSHRWACMNSEFFLLQIEIEN